MEKLSARIEELAKPEYPDYVDNMVHVKFNSWHYSDANLWASLVSQIFESLHDFTTDKKYGPAAVKQIYEQLNITNQQLEETNKKIEAHDAQEQELNKKKAALEKEIKIKKRNLSGWKPSDYIKVAKSDPIIQADFQKIKDQFGAEELIDNIDQIHEKVTQFESAWSKVVESISLLKKMDKGNWKWIWIVAGILFVIALVVTIPPVRIFIGKYINMAVVYSGLILTWIVNFIKKLAPWFDKIQKFFVRIKSLKNTVDKVQENVKLKEQDDLARINQEINELNARKAELESEHHLIIQKKTILEDELDEIGSGKKLSDFLASKTTDDIYTKQLGIISWIRKDFETLNDLFNKQKTIQKNGKKIPVKVKIDRIVLYIDDLDRCNEDVVVKVLEAIHLLLAFPLFVVIVGVDPRWLNNALAEKYKNLFGSAGNRNLKPAPQQALEADQNDIPLLTGIATSYDYLEKIFQIPFVLKPINETGRKKLISYLMKDEMKTEPVQAETPTGAEPSPTEKPVVPPDVAPSVEPALTEVTKQEPVQFENMTEQQKQEQAVKMKEKLEFTKEERDYMQSISALFGRTPRSINRYINIYRIIKAHGSMKVTGDFSRDEFVPIMFILGVIVGYGAYAEGFIAEIAKAEDEATFHEFIENSAINQKLKDEINKLSTDVDGIPMKDFKRNLDLISRFSFRTLIKAL